jgi:hypothetical protein
VRSTAQFLLYDDAPRRDFPDSDPRHWGTFQTGLRTSEGKKKNAYAGYQRPIFVDRRGRRVLVFGLYRPATDAVEAEVQFKPAGSDAWQTYARASTNGSGYLVLRRRELRAGAFRIAFSTGDGSVRTRAARVGVSR